MPSLKQIIASALLFTAPLLNSCPKQQVVHVERVENVSPIVSNNEDAPEWFIERKIKALSTIGESGFSKLLKDYHPTVIGKEKSTKLYGSKDEENPIFFGYNTINETHFTAVTYSKFDIDGTWVRDFKRWTKYSSSGSIDGEYCGYVRSGMVIIPVYVPLNTVPLTESVTFFPIENNLFSYETLNPVQPQIYTNSGDFFVNGDKLVGSGLLCYSVSKQPNKKFVESTKVPFEINYTPEVLSSLNDIPSTLSPQEFTKAIREKILPHYSYETTKEVGDELKEFYAVNRSKEDGEKSNLPSFLLNDLFGRADCDVHNTTTIAIVRDKFDQPANLQLGEYCRKPLQCESFDKITHAYATLPDGNGYRVKFDTTGKRKKKE